MNNNTHTGLSWLDLEVGRVMQMKSVVRHGLKGETCDNNHIYVPLVNCDLQPPFRFVYYTYPKNSKIDEGNRGTYLNFNYDPLPGSSFG